MQPDIACDPTAGASFCADGANGFPNMCLVFAASELAVRASLQSATSGLMELGLSADDQGMAEIVLAEVLNNITEHAYSGDAPGPRLIMLQIDVRHDGLDCLVSDTGKPMPGAALPEGKLAEIGPDICSLPEGGFGWFLIREQTRNLSYRRIGARNRLSFLIPRSGASSDTGDATAAP